MLPRDFAAVTTFMLPDGGAHEPDVGFPVLAHIASAVDVDSCQAGRVAAFADQTVVKATLSASRCTPCTPRTYPAFHNVMLRSLRAARLSDRRFIDTGAVGRRSRCADP